MYGSSIVAVQVSKQQTFAFGEKMNYLQFVVDENDFLGLQFCYGKYGLYVAINNKGKFFLSHMNTLLFEPCHKKTCCQGLLPG